MVAASAALFFFAALLAGRSGASSVFPKRGFVADGVKKGKGGGCDDPVLLSNSAWFYDYDIANPYRQHCVPGDCAKANETGRLDERFTPMAWCVGSVDDPIPSYVNRTFFMGFNEPMDLHSCNTPPEEAAEKWKTVMENFPTSKLVSPSVAHHGIDWYNQFLGNCTKMYGKEGCRISYVNTHIYSCETDHTMLYLKQLNDLYKQPVWLTEFSCGDAKRGRPTADHVKYMKAILPLLDAADYVYRYSWMSVRDPHGLRGLVETTADGTNQLTELGKIWNGESGDSEVFTV